MFRPDPNGPYSVEEITAKLTEVLKELPSDSQTAKKLAEMVRGLVTPLPPKAPAEANPRKRGS
jgi:hypothetical protein